MKMTIHGFTRRAACAAIVVALAGAAPAAQAPQPHVITMSNMSYGQMPGNVKVGDTILWVNRDTVLHSVTARDHSFDLRVAPGKSATLTLKKSGNIAFYCIFHAAMRGTLTVAP